jgi:hypothetical protein
MIENLPCTNKVKQSGHPHLILWGAAIPVHILECIGPVKHPEKNYYQLRFKLLISGYQWTMGARSLCVGLQMTSIDLPVWMESAKGTYTERYKVDNLLMQHVPAYAMEEDYDYYNPTTQQKEERKRNLPPPPFSDYPRFYPGNFGRGSPMMSEAGLLLIHRELLVFFQPELIGIIRDLLGLIYFPGISEFERDPNLRVRSSNPIVKFMDTGRIYISPPSSSSSSSSSSSFASSVSSGSSASASASASSASSASESSDSSVSSASSSSESSDSSVSSVSVTTCFMDPFAVL